MEGVPGKAVLVLCIEDTDWFVHQSPPNTGERRNSDLEFQGFTWRQPWVCPPPPHTHTYTDKALYVAFTFYEWSLFQDDTVEPLLTNSPNSENLSITHCFCGTR